MLCAALRPLGQRQALLRQGPRSVACVALTGRGREFLEDWFGLLKPGSLTGFAFSFHFPSPQLYLQQDLSNAPRTRRPFCCPKKCHQVTV